MGDTIQSSSANIVSATDYSPFGAPLAGRTFQAREYRFAFNGQEKDDEVAGAGNTMTAEFWEYDARLGRRWNLDPKPQISLSDYSCLGNNPLRYIDPKGDDKYKVDKDGNITLKRKTNKNYDKLVANGKIFNKSVKIEKGILGSQETVEAHNNSHGDFSYDKYLTRNINEGQKLFEFLSKNTDVEWTYAKFENKLLSYGKLFTSHKENAELGFTNYANKFGLLGLTEHNHNHPGSDKTPSGSNLDPNDPIEALHRGGDVGLAKEITSAISKSVKNFNSMSDLAGDSPIIETMPIFKIYTSDGVYTKFDQNTYIPMNLIIQPQK
jgi:RHS repeat-associated protein